MVATESTSPRLATDSPTVFLHNCHICGDERTLRRPDFFSSSTRGGDSPIAEVMLDLQAILLHLTEVGGSDLHVKAGSPPRVRVNGELRPTPFPALENSEVEECLRVIMPVDRIEEYHRTGEADFSLSIEGLGRFRGNAFRQRSTAAMVLRRVLPAALSVLDLGLPPIVTRLSEEMRGMVLVTGPTGSGKTTTLAAMIDHINQTRSANIITIEDPIEILHPDKRSIISQREIGSDTRDYAQAMRRVLRQDPDVILIGEMRDTETVGAALTAAETGHLVLSTLHTTNATETVHRIVDFFPPFQQAQIRLTLASVLRGVVSQRLVAHASGEGRVPAVEAMVVTGRIADRIVDPGGAGGESIEELIADGEYHGMQTFDQSLFALFKSGDITLRAAMAASTNPHDFRVALQTAGLLQTG
jgi:twitching motility protein PilT